MINYEHRYRGPITVKLNDGDFTFQGDATFILSLTPVPHGVLADVGVGISVDVSDPEVRAQLHKWMHDNPPKVMMRFGTFGGWLMLDRVDNAASNYSLLYLSNTVLRAS